MRFIEYLIEMEHHRLEMLLKDSSFIQFLVMKGIVDSARAAEEELEKYSIEEIEDMHDEYTSSIPLMWRPQAM